ncbi:MAG: PAS domain S-box protein [Spirochaetes bacterium]|nr:PAS domain S-box protein [Spirochaetota bacterium]
MKQNRKKSIFKLSITFTIIIFSLLFLFLFISINNFSDNLIRTNDLNALTLAGNMSNEYDRFFKQTESQLKIINENISRQTIHRSKINEYLRNIAAGNNSFEEIFILDNNGTLINHSYDNNFYDNFDYSSQKYFLKTKETGKAYYSDSFISFKSNKICITISAPGNNQIVCAIINIENLTSSIDKEFSDTGIWATITDRNGNIIYHPIKEYSEQRRNIKNETHIFEALSGKIGSYDYYADDKKIRVSVYPVTSPEWTVSIYNNYNKITAPAKSMKLLLIFAFSLTALFLFLTIYYFKIRFILPLNRIALQMSSISDGNYGIKLLHSDYSEISGFYETFSQMVLSVSSRENAILKSESLLDKIFKTMRDAITVCDKNGNITFMNPTAKKYSGLSVGDNIFKSKNPSIIYSDYKDEPIEKNLLPLYEAFKSKTNQTGIYKMQFADSVFKWVSEYVYAFEDDDHNFDGMLSCAADITELKVSSQKISDTLREKDILLKEIHHRVKNNLQIISSLLSLQANTIKNAEITSILSESRNRVKTMALIHEKLYQSSDLTRIEIRSYLKNLVQQIFAGSSADIRQISYEVRSDNVFMSIDDAVPCGLIINELVSNSIKHAFNDGRKGRIIVEFLLLPNGKRSLAVADDGEGIPHNFDIDKTDSLGMKLVSSLSKQIGGEPNIIRQDNGTAVIIIF